MNGEPSKEFSSPDEVRALFNSEILPRVADGRIREVVLHQGPPSPRSNQPRGTVSQILGYFDGGTMVCRAHRFLLQDGSVGGSGLPDPKWILHEDVILLAE